MPKNKKQDWTNLKTNLKNVPKELALKDFYRKVIGCPREDKLSYMLRFTSVPPEVVSYFLAHREFANNSRQRHLENRGGTTIV